MSDRRTRDKVKEIIIHCSASSPNTTFEAIKKDHINNRHFSDIGYHYVILSDGTVRQGRSWDIVGAHCENHNSDSLGICLVGGLDSKGKLWKFNDKQIESLKDVINGIRMSFGNIPIKGHYEYNPNKSCPCFNIPEFVKSQKVVYTVKG